MNEKVCRACFSLLKTKHYVSLNDETDIPDCTTVQDALAQILPNLNFGAVIEPALCISCLMVVKTTVKFKQTCLNNEQKLLQYLEDMEATKVSLKRVVDREELTEVISSEHDYILRYKTSRNLLSDEIKASVNKVEDPAVTECDVAPDDVMLQFNVNDSIDSYTEFSNDILKLFWDEEEPAVSVKVEMTEENVEQPVVDLKCMLEGSGGLGFVGTDNCAEQQGPEECADVKVWLDTFAEKPEIEFLQANVEITEDNNNMSVELDTTQEVPNEEDVTNPVIISCTICNLKFEGYKQAALHGKNKHGGDRMIYCKLCKKMFYTTRAYYVHNTTHGYKLGDVQGRLPRKIIKKREPKPDPDFFRLCAYCGLTFTRSLIFNNHMKRHEEGTPIECDICKKPFYTTKQMKRHKVKHCRKIKITQAKEFLCDFCGKYFDNYNRFYNHKKSHIKEGEFKCNQCAKVFTQRFKLRVHMKSHKTEKEYMCDVCGHLSKYPEAMRKHRKKHFTAPVKVIRHRCPVCSKGFESLSRMKTHVVIHSNLQPYQCEICERRFNVLNNLKRHMLVHTGEKPYTCNFCNRGFTQSGALKLHQTSTNCRERMETVSPNEVLMRDNKYECNICGREFKLYHWLRVHLAKHSEQDSLTCDVCGSTFSNKGNLRRHLMCHTGEKPFKCEFCLKTFRQKTELVVHTRRHTGEKPYRCEICYRSFVDYSEQKRHLKRHLGQLSMTAQEVDEKDETLLITFD